MSEEKSTPVNRQFIEDCIKKVLKAAADGKSSVMVRNPAAEFTSMAKAGRYDHLSDDTYNQMLSDCEFMALYVMQKKPAMSYGELLERFLSLASEDSRGYLPSQAASLADAVSGRKDISVNCDPYPAFGYPLFREEDPGTDSFRSPKLSDWDSVPPSEEDLSYTDADDVDPSYIGPTDKDWTPESIYKYLSLHIYGQEEAKKAAAMLFWNHLGRRPETAVFAGPTGCGKTAIWECLKKTYPYICIADASRISQEGWKGEYKFSDIFRSAEGDPSRQIYVLDEADKLFESRISSSGENVSYSIQNELLKALEGSQIRLDRYHTVDTSRCSFVFLGSFERMTQAIAEKSASGMGFGSRPEKKQNPYSHVFTPEDLIKYGGMRREIAGRVNRIVQMHPVTADDFRKILDTPSMSPVSEIEKLYGIRLHIPESRKNDLCQRAEVSGMGVRFLKSQIQTELDRKLFHKPFEKEYRLFEKE